MLCYEMMTVAHMADTFWNQRGCLDFYTELMLTFSYSMVNIK